MTRIPAVWCAESCLPWVRTKAWRSRWKAQRRQATSWSPPAVWGIAHPLGVWTAISFPRRELLKKRWAWKVGFFPLKVCINGFMDLGILTKNCCLKDYFAGLLNYAGLSVDWPRFLNLLVSPFADKSLSKHVFQHIFNNKCPNIGMTRVLAHMAQQRSEKYY